MIDVSQSGHYVGDCRELLAQLPDGCVQTVVTSPPYWGLRDYGTARWEGGDPTCDHMESKPSRTAASVASSTLVGSKTTVHASHVFHGNCGHCGAVRVDRQIGLEPTPDAYVASLVEVFREVRRVLREDGTLWLNLGDSYATFAGRVGEAPGGGEQGAKWRGDGMPKANGRGEPMRTRAERDPKHAGKNTAIGPMTQPNRMPIDGLKPKDLVGIPWMVAFALRADGWYLRQDIIWHKPNPMPESVADRCTKSHEYLFLLSKSERYYFSGEAIAERSAEAGKQSGIVRGAKRRANAMGVLPTGNEAPGADLTNRETRNKRSVWTVATEPYAGAHFACFPTKLIEPCILAGTKPGDIVLDPFFGAGTTGLVAKSWGRRYIGFDLGYHDLATKRLCQEVLPIWSTP